MQMQIRREVVTNVSMFYTALQG